MCVHSWPCSEKARVFGQNYQAGQGRGLLEEPQTAIPLTCPYLEWGRGWPGAAVGGQGQTRVTPETQSARAVWTRFVLWKVENGGKKGGIRGHRSPCPDGGVGHSAGWSLGLGHRADQGTGRRAREIVTSLQMCGASLKIGGLRGQRRQCHDDYTRAPFPEGGLPSPAVQRWGIGVMATLTRRYLQTERFMKQLTP